MLLYESVLNSMRKNIEDGTWPRGEIIPREIDLCDHYGVSRTTIRTAMMYLVNEGLVVRVKGVGTFVKTEEHLKSTTIFMSSFTKELEMQGKSVCTELLTYCIVSDVPEVNTALKLHPESRLLKISRLRYAQGEFEQGPIVLTTSFFDAKHHSDFQEFNLEKDSLYNVLKANGLTRTSITKKISAQQLTERECRMMGVNSQSLAIQVVSIALDQDQRELEYTISLYPVEKNKFEIKVGL